MPSTRLVLVVVVIAVCHGLSLADTNPPAGAGSLDAPLRYRFAVGDELVYRCEGHSVPQPGDRPDKAVGRREGVWKVWVVDRNRDGSWRLVIWHQVRLLSQAPGRAVVERAANRVLGYCDLFPDGRVISNATLGNIGDSLWRIEACALFIPLPPDKGPLAGAWSADGPATANGKFHFDCSLDRGSKSSGPTVAIDCVESSPLHGITRERINRHCLFDRTAGRLREYQRDIFEAAAKRQWQQIIEVHLESASRKPTAWIAQLKREAEKFFEVSADYDRQAVEVGRVRTPKECERRQRQARGLLIAGRGLCSLDLVREQYDALLKAHDGDVERNIADAKVREGLYASPPADWELADFNGMKHRLKDYRGKVVILDFWYRSCSWCLLALPQVKEVARTYKNRGVVMLGMNTDNDDEDARCVIREMKLAYPNLKAKSAEPIYAATAGSKGRRIMSSPSLFILDQDGRIADIHIGYAPDLAQRVSKTVDRLLHNRATAAK